MKRSSATHGRSGHVALDVRLCIPISRFQTLALWSDMIFLLRRLPHEPAHGFGNCGESTLHVFTTTPRTPVQSGEHLHQTSQAHLTHPGATTLERTSPSYCPSI